MPVFYECCGNVAVPDKTEWTELISKVTFGGFNIQYIIPLVGMMKRAVYDCEGIYIYRVGSLLQLFFI